MSKSGRITHIALIFSGTRTPRWRCPHKGATLKSSRTMSLAFESWLSRTLKDKESKMPRMSAKAKAAAKKKADSQRRAAATRMYNKHTAKGKAAKAAGGGSAG